MRRSAFDGLEHSPHRIPPLTPARFCVSCSSGIIAAALDVGVVIASPAIVRPISSARVVSARDDERQREFGDEIGKPYEVWLGQANPPNGEEPARSSEKNAKS